MMAVSPGNLSEPELFSVMWQVPVPDSRPTEVTLKPYFLMSQLHVKDGDWKQWSSVVKPAQCGGYVIFVFFCVCSFHLCKYMATHLKEKDC